ncbi:MAG: M20 family peptidase [Alphaproteobacteria bacterium]
MKKIVLALLGALGIMLAVALVRTARFTSRQILVPPAKEVALERDKMAGRLSEAIQYQTVSDQAPTPAAAAEFTRFHAFLAKAFPLVHARLTKEIVGAASLLYTWGGQDKTLKPALLMGHMDVVPVDANTEKNWTYPPFSGRTADGYIWGRGTMDDKVNVLGILEAAEYLLARGFNPRRALYFAFGHDEEIGGRNGAFQIAALLRRRNIELEYILDEGGNIVDGIIPSTRVPVALIGIAEKGYVSLELTVEMPGGHASTPPDHTAIGVLSSAIAKLEASPFSARLSEPIRQMIAFIGPEMPWPKQFVLANLWLFGPLLEQQLAQSPLTNALIRTTQAATVFHSGVKENVLPAHARAIINVRILPGDTISGAIDHARRIIGRDQVKISPLAIRAEPSAISDPESPSFERLHRTIKEVAPEVLVAPSLLVAATDSHHYAPLSKHIFRFLPITITSEDARRFHGIDERISVKDYERCVRFFVQLMRNSDS